MTLNTLTAHQINTKIRASIVQRLPEAIETAMQSYMRFVDGGLIKQPTAQRKEKIPSIEYDRVEFKAHHDACKVALAHINLLLDLAKDLLAHVETEDANRAAVDALTAAVQKAQGEIAGRRSGHA